MIKFRQKQFTIPEGHYTGPKDMDKVPGVMEMVGKSALAGSGIGAVVGGLMKDSSVLSGAVQGAKYGSLSGILLKFFINYLHNPMTSIKYRDVDKTIRREFGVYRMSGITVGDTVSKRADIDERFGFNDRNVTSYKVNIAVQDNSVVLYTFGMTDKELDTTSRILDYYCKKYFAMEYTASVINAKVNAYSVAIVFTNYQVISNFIMELSKELGSKINLLDNKALVSGRLSDAAADIDGLSDERQFSVSVFSKYDLIKLLGKSGKYAISGLRRGAAGVVDGTLLGMLLGGLEKLSADEASKVTGTKIPRGDYGNVYLQSTLEKLGYVEKYDYTVGEGPKETNISLFSGILLITVPTGSKSEEEIDKKVWSKSKNVIKKVTSGDVVLYSYTMASKNELEFILRRFMSTRTMPNIFEK